MKTNNLGLTNYENAYIILAWAMRFHTREGAGACGKGHAAACCVRPRGSLRSLCLLLVPSGGILSERAESMQRRAQGGHFRLCPPCGSPRTDQRGPSAPSGYPRMGALSKNTGDSCRVQTPRRELPHPKDTTREQRGEKDGGKLPMRGFPKGADGPLWSAWKGVRGENPVERVFPSCPFFPHSFRQRKEWGPRREQAKDTDPAPGGNPSGKRSTPPPERLPLRKGAVSKAD